MEGVGEPSLIIEGTSNPHTFVFKPSHAQMLEEADIVFWIGEDLEAFMEKPLILLLVMQLRYLSWIKFY